MTRREKHRLIRAFEVAYELAYRRGFHHGFVARDESPAMTERQVAAWRSGPVRRGETPPPGRGGCVPRMIGRMVSESREHGNLIREFVNAEPQIDTGEGF